MRVNKAIEDGSFFENPALRAAFERGRRVHLLGLVSHGGVHSHIDHLQALLRFAPEKTWIHAFTDGRDVSPTLGRARPRRAATRAPRDRRRPLLRDGPRPALGAHAARVRRDHASRLRRHGRRRRRARGRAAELRRAASRTSSSSRSCVEGAPGLEPGDTVDLLQLPARPRPPADAPAARQRLRRDDDDALRVRPRHAGRVRRAGRRRTRSPRCSRSAASGSCTSPRPRSTPT